MFKTKDISEVFTDSTTSVMDYSKHKFDTVYVSPRGILDDIDPHPLYPGYYKKFIYLLLHYTKLFNKKKPWGIRDRHIKFNKHLADIKPEYKTEVEVGDKICIVMLERNVLYSQLYYISGFIKEKTVSEIIISDEEIEKLIFSDGTEYPDFELVTIHGQNTHDIYCFNDEDEATSFMTSVELKKPDETDILYDNWRK